jgi:uncharacterized OsmC-like protein
MTGTLGGALEARGIKASEGSLVAEAAGEVELEEGVLILRRIHIVYRLEGCPEEKREAARRAHAVHQRHCPVARSIGGSVTITSELAFVG